MINSREDRIWKGMPFTVIKKLGKIQSDYGKTVPPCVLVFWPWLNSVFAFLKFCGMDLNIKELDN